MTPEMWKKITEIYNSAQELEPAERRAFLDKQCDGDDALRGEVESLLTADEKAGDFINQPVLNDAALLEIIEDRAALIGKQLRNYKVVSQIGTGGMGKVYLAEDSRLGRKVALKILPSHVSSQLSYLRRFENEAKAISALNHPNILTIYEITEYGGVHFIVTEFVAGETLRDSLEHKTLTLRETLDIAMQIASALAAAHEVGVIHRDIKPENIMIREDGYVKVLDFGLAKLIKPQPISEENRTLIHSIPGVVMGTPSYMSPEQARGLKVDLRTDVWSFGVVLYELLARRSPFYGETATDVILSIIQNEPPALQNIASDLPDKLYLIIDKLLRKSADERYQSIKEVFADLHRLKQKLDYQEIERALSPGDSKARIAREQKDIKVVSSDPKGSIFSASNFSPEKLPPNNLSNELSVLIGRASELKEIKDLLHQADIRLLTITGVGGTGKTRLAQAITHQALEEFTDGVYFINLSAIESAELVMPILAQTLGIREEGGKPLKEYLREYLRGKKILLVLDNFEQIAQAAPQVGELLSSSMSLKILVTSRVRLYLRFEQEFPLQPLEIPDKGDLKLSELKANPSVKLFVERARAVKPTFALTEDNAQSVAEICRRLDGIPLAIELAAVRVKLLAPQAILSRLSNSLKLLTGGARDLPERQQTMRGAIEWSYDLLGKEERRLLNRLAVFAGGFTLEAAEAVGDAAGDLGIDLLDAAASLVDKSLLVQREMANGEPRFRVLEVVREFALEQLEQSGESGKIKRLHAEFNAQMAETAEPELDVSRGAELLEMLEQEHDNLRAAMEWSLENEPEIALRIVGSLRNFFIRRGYLSEGYNLIKRALEKSGEFASLKSRAKAYCGIGTLSRLQGNLEAAQHFIQESLRLSREIDDKYLISISVGGLGSVKNQQGDLNQAKILMEEALAIARELNNKTQISSKLNSLGEIARLQKDYTLARKYYEEALTIARQESAKLFISFITLNLAMVTCYQRDYDLALSFALESLQSSEEFGDKIPLGILLSIFAALAIAAGETEKAARLFGATQAIFDEMSYKLEKADQIFVDRYLGKTRAAMGNEAFDKAFQKGKQIRLKKAIALARESS